jgi:hypothetical protein
MRLFMRVNKTVDRVTHNPFVQGSSPCRPTIYSKASALILVLGLFCIFSICRVVVGVFHKSGNELTVAEKAEHISIKVDILTKR